VDRSAAAHSGADEWSILDRTFVPAEREAWTISFRIASSASLRDAFGHVWVLPTLKHDLAAIEIERRGNAFPSPVRRSSPDASLILSRIGDEHLAPRPVTWKARHVVEQM